MYLIVGLGNPGEEYKNTRHNVGFSMIDIIAEKYNISVNRLKYKGKYGEGFIRNEKVILLKPETYMNLSGESVIQVVDFYKIPNENIIVLYDDVSLDVGRLRIRPDGSSGGHNGIKNIVFYLASEVFPRIKIGVGAPKGNLVSHVLGKFSEEEKTVLNKVYEEAAKAVETIIADGTTEAMNKFNSFKCSAND